MIWYGRIRLPLLMLTPIQLDRGEMWRSNLIGAAQLPNDRKGKRNTTQGWHKQLNYSQGYVNVSYIRAAESKIVYIISEA
jgi:hypothetical protein